MTVGFTEQTENMYNLIFGQNLIKYVFRQQFLQLYLFCPDFIEFTSKKA